MKNSKLVGALFSALMRVGAEVRDLYGGLTLRSKITFLSAAVICFLIVWTWVGGYYPVIVFGNGVILERELQQSVDAARSYYERDIASAKAAGVEAEALGAVPDFEALAVEDLVERRLIRAALRERLSAAALREALADLLDPTTSPAFRRDATSFYGIDFETVFREVLLPQAERDMLRADIVLNGEQFEAWLLEAKKSQRALILIPGLSWEEGRVLRKR